MRIVDEGLVCRAEVVPETMTASLSDAGGGEANSVAGKGFQEDEATGPGHESLGVVWKSDGIGRFRW